jgi:hypothetical protein
MASFPIDTLLIAEKVTIAEVISPNFMTLKEDVLFIANGSKDTLLYQYVLPQFECIYKGGHIGSGPDEFTIFPSFCQTLTDDIFIWGYTPNTIRRFRLDNDKQLAFEQEYKLARNEIMNQMHVVDDSMLVYNDNNFNLALKKIDLKTGKMVATLDLGKEDHPDAFFYKNRGYMAANDQYIVYVYVYKKQIDVYRASDFSLYKRIVDDSAPSRVVIGHQKECTSYYGMPFAGRDCFYTLCEDGKETVLEVFDYEGHAIAKYHFDIVPYTYVVDEKQNMLYGYNYKQEDYLLKFKMK